MKTEHEVTKEEKSIRRDKKEALDNYLAKREEARKYRKTVESLKSDMQRIGFKNTYTHTISMFDLE